MGMGPACRGERRVVGTAGPVVHARGEDGLNPPHQAQKQGNQQQACFEISPESGSDEDDEDEEQPADDPEAASQENDG